MRHQQAKLKKHYQKDMKIEKVDIQELSRQVLGMEIPNWPPDNIAELSKKLEEAI